MSSTPSIANGDSCDAVSPPPFVASPDPANIAMSTGQHMPDTGSVVAAVEMLQQRKLKPDKERIYNYMEKHWPSKVYKDPLLVDRLINDALSQSLIVSVNNLDVFSFRTPSKIGRMLRVTKIVAWEGHVPQSVVVEVLRAIGAVEEAAPESTEESPKGIGVSPQEIVDQLHNNLRLLNYNAKTVAEKVLPIAINEGLAKLLPRQFYTLTEQCRSQLAIILLPSSCETESISNPNSPDAQETTNDQCLNHELALSKEKQNLNNSSHSSKSIAADNFSDSELSLDGRSSSSSSKRRPHENEDEEDVEDIEDTRGVKELEKEEEPTAVEIEEKEVVNEETKSPEVKDISNVPQRVSTRKRFKKSLGPDFVDSSDQMSYYMKDPNPSAKCGICNVLFAKGKPSIMGRKSKGASDKQEVNDKIIIQCSKCEMKVHTSCLSLKEPIGAKSQWKCAACGVCSMCTIKSKRKEFIISCSKCNRGFHTCCTLVERTSLDNTSWQCTHCTDQFRDEIKSKSSADSGKAKSSLLNKPPAKQITPTVITGGGAIVSSKSLLPKVSPTTSSVKPVCPKVNSHSVSYVSKETTLLLPKPNEVPASNSLLMPIPANSTTIKMNRPQTNNIIFNSITKKKKKLTNPKKTSEILFKKAERSKNRSESNSTTNGDIEAGKEHSQKTVKVLKKCSNKSQQLSLIKPIEDNSSIKEEVEDTHHTVPVVTSPVLSPFVVNSHKKCRASPNFRTLFDKNSSTEIKHSFIAWINCELKHLVKCNPKPLCSLSSNINEWSAQDVYIFLDALGFTQTAKFLLDNQVDGIALLLLRRKDLVQRLSLKLGPALKLHAFLTRIRKEFDM